MLVPLVDAVQLSHGRQLLVHRQVAHVSVVAPDGTRTLRRMRMALSRRRLDELVGIGQRRGRRGQRAASRRLQLVSRRLLKLLGHVAGRGESRAEVLRRGSGRLGLATVSRRRNAKYALYGPLATLHAAVLVRRQVHDECMGS